MAKRGKAPSNVSQLRRDIDKGKTGDKVAGTDPAAAPLGTDDEAAGTSPVVEGATARPGRDRHPDPAPNAANPEQTPDGRPRKDGAKGAIIMILIGIALVVFWLIFGLGAGS